MPDRRRREQAVRETPAELLGPSERGIQVQALGVHGQRL
jgi:hypothetical protein